MHSFILHTVIGRNRTSPSKFKLILQKINYMGLQLAYTSNPYKEPQPSSFSLFSPDL
jgi:hypothetical protein